MEVREAVEADAERMADIAGSPADVMRNLIHDRTVRVACEHRNAVADDATEHERERTSDTGDATAGGDGDSDQGGEGNGTIVALVSFDALEDTVHVTQLAGPPDACRRLLQEPVGFAEHEGMSVELLVPSGDDDVESAAEAAGFAPTGSGPEFGGRSTTRYRLEPGTAHTAGGN